MERFVLFFVFFFFFFFCFCCAYVFVDFLQCVFQSVCIKHLLRWSLDQTSIRSKCKTILSTYKSVLWNVDVETCSVKVQKGIFKVSISSKYKGGLSNYKNILSKNNFQTTKIYHQNTNIYCPRTKVLCPTTKVYCPTTTVYCQRTKVYCQPPKVHCQCTTKCAVNVQKYSSTTWKGIRSDYKSVLSTKKFQVQTCTAKDKKKSE